MPGITRQRPPRRGGRRAVALAAAAIVVLVAVPGAATFAGSASDNGPDVDSAAAPHGQLLIGPSAGDPPADRPASGWSGSAFFGEPTNTVLVLDTRPGGLLAVDLDTQAAARLPAQRPLSGAWDARVWHVDGALVVGADRIHAVSTSDAAVHLLGEASSSVAAAEPGHVWLIGDEAGGRRATYRLMDVDGTVRLESPAVEDTRAVPRRGVIGGLVLETDDGVAIWDAGSEEITVRLGKGRGSVSDARGRTVVWCEGDCTRLNVTNLERGHHSFPAPEPGAAYLARTARLSPDGATVAAVVAGAGPGVGEAAGSVVVVDVATGETTSVTPWLTPRPTQLAWTSDGRQLFFSNGRADAADTDLGRYLPAEARVELAVLPMGGVVSLIPLTGGQAGALLAGGEPLP